MIQTVAKGLGELKDEVVFVGGSVAELYADNPDLSDIRPTNDVDCIIKISSKTDYDTLEEKLRRKKFQHDISPNAPVCRKIYQGIKVDIMPTDEEILGFSNRWYVRGINHKTDKQLPDSNTIYILPIAYYWATKLEALNNRGGTDIRGSHDWEDIVYILYNCKHLETAINQNNDRKLKTFLKEQASLLCANSNIREFISSALSPNEATDETVDFIYDIIHRISKTEITEIMIIEQQITKAIIAGIKALYGVDVPAEQIQLQKTKKEFKGHLTLVVFPFLRLSKKSPELTAQEIGNFLHDNEPAVASYNVIKGFLNLTVAPSCWIDLLNDIHSDAAYGRRAATDQSPLVMIEYSSPNTNKPLHLGHIRNNLLGYSLSEIMKANGYKVVKTNIVNDRGIHICKSMLAWEKWGNGETPESSGKKGDHLIGDYYVLFDKKYKEELKALEGKGLSKEEAEAQSVLMAEARDMLRRWEAGDTEVRSLWKMMNSWVYAGFDITYKRLGVDFDKIYYESETYLEGKNEVMRGLKEGIFYQREDGSVWANLTSEGLDEKVLLRADGTSVYMTQDIGTAKLRFDDYPINKMIYVVGNEQNYHFQALSILLDKLGFAFGKGLVHFSYGMVELPEGKMKSREGTVVDADDLMEEMINTAREISQELGKLDEMTAEEAADISHIVGMGSLKYFILKVDPRKNMTFNPKESIDFNGNTGSFIQYTYARIRSVLRKATEQGIVCPDILPASIPLSEKEENLIQLIADYAPTVAEAGTSYSPALICNYIYDLVKEYNQFYHDYSILREENEPLKKFRLVLSANVAKVVKSAMSLLGVEVPERM